MRRRAGGNDSDSDTNTDADPGYASLTRARSPVTPVDALTGENGGDGCLASIKKWNRSDAEGVGSSSEDVSLPASGAKILHEYGKKAKNWGYKEALGFQAWGLPPNLFFTLGTMGAIMTQAGLGELLGKPDPLSLAELEKCLAGGALAGFFFTAYGALIDIINNKLVVNKLRGSVKEHLHENATLSTTEIQQLATEFGEVIVKILKNEEVELEVAAAELQALDIQVAPGAYERLREHFPVIKKLEESVQDKPSFKRLAVLMFLITMTFTLKTWAEDERLTYDSDGKPNPLHHELLMLAVNTVLSAGLSLAAKPLLFKGDKTSAATFLSVVNMLALNLQTVGHIIDELFLGLPGGALAILDTVTATVGGVTATLLGKAWRKCFGESGVTSSSAAAQPQSVVRPLRQHSVQADEEFSQSQGEEDGDDEKYRTAGYNPGLMSLAQRLDAEQGRPLVGDGKSTRKSSDRRGRPSCVML